MKRLSIAAVLAIILHGTLLVVEFPEPENCLPMLPEFKTINFSLVEGKPEILKKGNLLSSKPVQEIKKEQKKEKPLQKQPPPVTKAKVKIVQPVKQKKLKKKVETKKTVIKKIVESSTPEQFDEALNETVEVPVEPTLQPPTASALNDTIEKDEKAPPTSTSQVIQEARPLYLENPPPHYPTMARKRKYEGMVMLEVFVDREGSVAEVRLFKTSGYQVLDKAALKSVTDWKFEPARRGRQAVSMWVRVPIRFRLKD
jgi:periplasmic protein TonB